MRLVAAVTGLLVAVAVPAMAQLPSPAGEMPEGYGVPHSHGNPMFAGMSEPGRAIMRAAMKSADAQQGRIATAAARDRMLAVLDADRLDVPALRRAMDDEREAANAAKVRHQAALIAGLQQLSLADRRMFVANAQAMRTRMEGKTAAFDARRGGPAGILPPQ